MSKRQVRLRRLLLLVAALSAACPHASGQSATVQGTVRDGHGIAIGGAAVKLICDADASLSAQSISAANGAYRFSAVLPCAYHLLAEFDGAASSAIIVAVKDSGGVSHDLIVPSGHPGPELAESAAKPKFEASGIRGLIDPGGYSAPANAAAASGLLSGMADMKRAEPSGQGILGCAAEAGLVRAATVQPASAVATMRLGEFYLDHGMYGKALPYLQAAQGSAAKNLTAQLDTVEALIGLQRFGEARAQLTAVPGDPHNVRLHQLLARADEGLGQFRQASTEYLQLSAVRSSEQDAFGAGYETILDGRPAAAESIFREALHRYPRSMLLLIGEGTAEFLQGRAPASVDLLLQAADLDPTDPRPYPLLVAASATSSLQAVRVLAVTRRHLELAPRDAKGLLAYASLLERGERAQPGTAGEIRSLLDRAVALQPDLVQAYFQLGILDARSGENAKAIAAFRKVLQLDPSQAEAHYRLSLVLRRSGDISSAEGELKLFQQTRAQGDAGENADVRKFLSVMQTSPAGNEVNVCPGDTLPRTTAPS